MSSSSTRLVEYIACIVFDETHSHHGISVGDIQQRFPEKDWTDCPFPRNVEMFCQPKGWKLNSEQEAPIFFVSTLTDEIGERQFACCLSLYERVDNPWPHEDDELSLLVYKPKTLVILSRYPFFDLFRLCLQRIFNALADGDNEGEAESMVAMLVAGVHLIGDREISYSLGNQRLSIRPIRNWLIPVTASRVTTLLRQLEISYSLGNQRLSIRPIRNWLIPVTASRVATLLKRLGTTHNLLYLISALLADHRILLYSTSLNRLTDCCFALTALLYPFKYPHTYVPILPEAILEVLESPTPYIMGVQGNMRLRSLTSDVLSVDLDTGEIIIPDDVTVPSLPEPANSRLISSLEFVMSPGLRNADCAFQMGMPPYPCAEILDKRIRACFLRFFAEILLHYRSCLELVRLHDRPLIVFHKAAFVGMRHFGHSPLLHSLIDGLLFQSFISVRGLPFRVCDIFDETVATFEDQLKLEKQNRDATGEHIRFLADKLALNELQEPNYAAAPISPKPVVVERLRNFVDAQVDVHITRLQSASTERRTVTLMPRIVPVSLTQHSITNETMTMDNSNRRLQVLNNCLKLIFDAKIPDAKKLMSAVELSLRTSSIRVSLCQLLWRCINAVSKATLNTPQFELIIRLMNCSLQQESVEDEHGIAYAMLTLSNIYCRRLSTGVHQFAYTCIQDHPVWSNPRFWESAFFHDVHQQIRRLYLPESTLKRNECPFSLENHGDTWNLCEQPTAMALAADRLARLSSFDVIELARHRDEELSIVSGQAKHFINLMVHMRTPLDVSKLRRVNVIELERRSTTPSVNLISDGDGSDAASMVEEDDQSLVESGFAESTISDLGAGNVRWIARLVDRFCSEAGLDEAQIDRLKQGIPGFVALHIETLEQVYAESKRLSPINKAALLQPILLPGERVIVSGLRVFLLPDGRDVQTNSSSSDANVQTVGLVPAEGALFLTNYRVIFKGLSCDPFACAATVIRTIPIASLAREKVLNDQTLQNVPGIAPRTALTLHDPLQLRSATFQLMRVAFDEEVNGERVEQFINTLETIRWPPTIHSLFAFSVNGSGFDLTVSTGAKNRYNTIRDIKRSIFKTAKSGLLGKTNEMDKVKKKRQEMVAATLPPRLLNTSIGPGTSASFRDRTLTPQQSETTKANGTMMGHTDSRHYLTDYIRLNLIGPKSGQNKFRMSQMNRDYVSCKGYPFQFIIPASIGDESLSKVSRCFKQGRLPVICWQSPNGALLLRSASLAQKTVVSRIRKQAVLIGAAVDAASAQPHTAAASAAKLSMASRDSLLSSNRSSIEQERYLLSIAALSPGNESANDHLLSGSLSSLISLESSTAAEIPSSSTTVTPELQRRLAIDPSIRQGAIGAQQRNNTGRLSAVKSSPLKRISVFNPSTSIPSHSSQSFSSSQATRGLARFPLYILGERSQAKLFKMDRGYEFIPVDYPQSHNLKSSFKKLMRVMCPSWSTNGEEAAGSSYLKLLNDSGWQQMVSGQLKLASAVIDVIDLQQSSVLICLEEGSDAVPQLISLAQILLDPFYRTFVGFRVLVEKDWLAFGHRFSHRQNHTTASQNSGLAPFFVQFLDCLHQIMCQYPFAFEYNQFFIKYMAYHSSSAFFTTFLLDSEAERRQIPSNGSMDNRCIWSYIEQRNKRSHLFYNFNYLPSEQTVLRPSVEMAAMRVWTFYTEDFLAHGSPYDIECVEMELAVQEEERCENSSNVDGQSSERVLRSSHNCMELVSANAIQILLERYARLKPLLLDDSSGNDEEADQWQTLLRVSNAQLQSDDYAENLAWSSHLQNALHKRDTLRLLLHGNSQIGTRMAPGDLLATPGTMVSSSHRFRPFHLSAADSCAVCKKLLSGIVIKYGQRCSDCGLLCHEKCVQFVNVSCVLEEDNASRRGSRADRPPLPPPLPKKEKSIDLPATHSGILWKQGAKFKIWTKRWFVLDGNRHELRYYESESDGTPRGVVNLADVQSVQVMPFNGASGSVRRCTAMLEIVTRHRTFQLATHSTGDAELWMEKIEGTLRE